MKPAANSASDPASRRPADPRRLDLKALARTGDALSGSLPLDALARLRAAIADKQVETPDFANAADVAAMASRADAAWSARVDASRKIGSWPVWWLELAVDANLPLQCQRCLEPLSWPLHVRRSIGFVDGEATAERLDEDSEEDILPLPPRLDLAALIEDELILALPLIAMHEQCPQPLAVPSDVDAAPAWAEAGANEAGDAAAERPSPFAALAGLKVRRG